MNTLKKHLALRLWAYGMLQFSQDGFDVVSARHGGKEKSPYLFDLDIRNLRSFSSWHDSYKVLQEEMAMLMAKAAQQFAPAEGWTFWTSVPNAEDLLPPTEVLQDTYNLPFAGLSPINGEKKEDSQGLHFGVTYFHHRITGDETVLVCEDALNTGLSSVGYIRMLKEMGLTCTHLLALIDRQNGGRAAVEAEDVHVYSVFTVKELFELYLEEGVLLPWQAQIARTELDRIG